ncbi:Uncharacterised protein [Candidatus Bilamarchaeum dharawalense]|uniref:Uncharacterized protein n=1 Tax=Candidatus Bilamarchaeum dharawalense TaxID=2885759 RepID=A0A5E4LMX6_9ARCH|nr:Uncharacterised protein [Candidatus Bilamarchaeum dharawalense]
MAKENKMNYGQYAFLGGFAIAVILGLASNMLGTALPLALAVMGLLGIIVGLMNVGDKEVMPFLVATVALLMVIGSINQIVANMNTITGGIVGPVGIFIANFLSALSAFVAPAAFVVAIKQIYDLAKPG